MKFQNTIDEKILKAFRDGSKTNSSYTMGIRMADLPKATLKAGG